MVIFFKKRISKTTIITRNHSPEPALVDGAGGEVIALEPEHQFTSP